jgi:hypothetical protein
MEFMMQTTKTYFEHDSLLLLATRKLRKISDNVKRAKRFKIILF